MTSVIIPVYNSEKYLQQAISSIINQTEKDLEVIIINDGSTDNSEEIVKSFSDPRIRYYKQENSGAAAARNFGIDVAKGEFIALQDADDISLPSRLEVLKRQFICDGIGLVHSDVMLIDEHNNPVGYYVNRNIERKRALRYFLKTGTPVCGGSMMVRKEVFQNLRYDTSLIIGEDSDLLFQICRKWVTVHVPEPLYLYRRNFSSTSYTCWNFDNYYRHLRKMLDTNNLEELFPELDWVNGDDIYNKAIALSISSLIMFRRDLLYQSKELITEAYSLLQSKGSNGKEYIKGFIFGVSSMLLGNYNAAIQFFLSCGRTDHLVENYVGECHALKGDICQAQQHFIQALCLLPEYEDAIDNLKAAAGKTGQFNLGDNTSQKFLRGYNTDLMKSILGS